MEYDFKEKPPKCSDLEYILSQNEKWLELLSIDINDKINSEEQLMRANYSFNIFNSYVKDIKIALDDCGQSIELED
jgi:hypothetical protein